MLKLAGIEAMQEAARGRRGAERHCLTMRTAKVRCESGEYACIIRDVSTTGTKLQFFHTPPPDQYLYLELQSGALFAVECRWSDDTFAGYRFSGPVDVGEFIDDQGPHARRPIRLRFNQPVTVRSGETVSHAMLADLSQHGACIEAGRIFAGMQLVRLEIEGLPERIGHVCWRRDYAHGIVFQESIALRTLALHAYRLQPYPELPTALPGAESPEFRSAG